MVSNSLNIALQELLDTIERMRKEHGRSEEYLKLRKDLPKDWPL
jgi:hypothetical protein